jgi:H+-transporting ATPase
MLSVAGHLTIFQTRTRGPWWSTRPAWILLAAVCGTQAIATLIAVYGVGLVTPLGWKYAGMVWAYAFAWFLLTDPVKLLAYWILDSTKPDAAPMALAAAVPAASAATGAPVLANAGTDNPAQAGDPPTVDPKAPPAPVAPLAAAAAATGPAAIPAPPRTTPLADPAQPPPKLAA